VNPQHSSETTVVQASQIVFGVLLIIVLLGMAGFFGWRQLLTLRGLRTADNVSDQDRRYMSRQAWRRLTCSVIMVVLAGMLAMHYTLEPAANELAQKKEVNPAHEFTAAEEQFTRTYAVYWGIVLLLLLTIIILAGIDFFAIRRFGLRHYRQIQADRRAMIEGELSRIRSQRNGHGG
jgi:hypothetical protein